MAGKRTELVTAGALLRSVFGIRAAFPLPNSAPRDYPLWTLVLASYDSPTSDARCAMTRPAMVMEWKLDREIVVPEIEFIMFISLPSACLGVKPQSLGLK
jgi:hypothetical protein